MKKKYKIVYVTTSRSDFGLNKDLIVALSKNKRFELFLLITGSHLIKNQGNSSHEINKFNIKKKFKINFKNKKIVNPSMIMGEILPKASKQFKKISPDLVIIMGDRYEAFICCLASYLNQFPVLHLSGGEVTSGSFDDGFRHAMTKLSNLHFVTNQIHRKRVIQLGENSKFVKNTGEIGIENIKKIKLFNKTQLSSKFKINFNDLNFLITFHPETNNLEASQRTFENIIKSMKKIKRKKTLIFTTGNIDPGYNFIQNYIKKFVLETKDAFHFKSLGRQGYLSVLNQVDLVIGNSSSAIIESSFFGTKCLNVGNRQKGRIQPANVFNCNGNAKNIFDNLKKILKKKRKIFCSNPYYQKNSIKKSIKYILEFLENNNNITKEFKDLNIYVQKK